MDMELIKFLSGIGATGLLAAAVILLLRAYKAKDAKIDAIQEARITEAREYAEGHAAARMELATVTAENARSNENLSRLLTTYMASNKPRAG